MCSSEAFFGKVYYIYKKEKSAKFNLGKVTSRKTIAVSQQPNLKINPEAPLYLPQEYFEETDAATEYLWKQKQKTNKINLKELLQ